MRVAQVSPLYERVPPLAYGGTERVVGWLTDGLVERGHDVTLFASGDSSTAARLVPGSACAVRLIENSADAQAFHFAMLEEVVRRSAEFDIVHFHTDYLGFPFARRLVCPSVTTLHWRMDVPGLADLYRQFADIPLVSISNAQRAPVPWANWRATIGHGLPERLYRFRAEAGGHVAFLGRIAPAKRPDLAIEIAARAGVPIEIAAKIDNGDRDYYEKRIARLFDMPHVRFRGELDDAGKSDLLGGARALLFPIDWPEPFGLVMIEALACGTPVIAFGNGSVTEIIEDGVTGFIVDSVEEAVAAVKRVGTLSRVRCREEFERRFTVQRMVDAYLGVYEELRNARRAGESRGTREADMPAPMQAAAAPK
jgi:glycosyltransferase involved in cell wall biosynthesis